MSGWPPLLRCRKYENRVSGVKICRDNDALATCRWRWTPGERSVLRADRAPLQTYFRRRCHHAEGIAMKWKTPVIIEIAVGLEINAYACAEVK
jgi:coenzyme PQQ precursor peptide PqqA